MSMCARTSPLQWQTDNSADDSGSVFDLLSGNDLEIRNTGEPLLQCRRDLLPGKVGARTVMHSVAESEVFWILST